MDKTVTTAPCPGCGTPLTLAPVAGQEGRLRGCCFECNGGRPVLDVWAEDLAPAREKPKTRKKRRELDERSTTTADVLGGDLAEDDTGSGFPFAP
jgi:hypothetical protein